MDDAIRHVVVLGGGSAGWLVAGLLAADHAAAVEGGLRVTLVESPDTPPIGVGEGTWPTMRDTLRRIGVSESAFVRECDAAFKQGSKFVRWAEDRPGDHYHHPFMLPQGYPDADLVDGWMRRGDARFADLACVQPGLCEAGRAPKQFATPEYAAVANYGYHLDAGRLGGFLAKHCVDVLGVHHLVDHVDGVVATEAGDIAALRTRGHGALAGDLFVDCTGMRALLIGGHYGLAAESCARVLFNDRALAVQVPHASPDTPVGCQTVSTAQSAGWIWDIALQSRRGIGYVYSSAHASDDAARDTLSRYLAAHAPALDLARATPPRRIDIRPGFRRTSWHRNCVAIGLSSGFVEPLEASSLVLVELAATMLSDQLPATRATMDAVAAQFNDSFSHRWDRIVDFLKLHYVLSRRDDGDYWRDHRDPASGSDRLTALLALWRRRPPSRHDFPRAEEIFPAASHQYVLYGMGFRPDPRPTARRAPVIPAGDCFREAADLARRMHAALPSHRGMLDHVVHRGMPRI